MNQYRGQYGGGVQNGGIASRIPDMTMGKWLGAVSWLPGLVTTVIFTHGTGLTSLISDSWWIWIIDLVIGILVQSILTYLESPIWLFQWKFISGWVALAVDVFINTGGAWIIVKGISKTGSAAAIRDITGTVADAVTNNPQAAQGGIKMLLWVILGAIILAALPEVLWRMDARRAGFATP